MTHPAKTADRAAPPWLWIGFAAAVVSLVLAAYLPRDCGFVCDDLPLLAENPVVQAGDLATAAVGRGHVLGNRPVTCVALTLEYLAFGPHAVGFRRVSLALHLLNVLLLFAAVRGTLRSPALLDRFAPPRANRLALAVAAVWSVHPLGVDAVAYSVQQSTLLASTCLLAAIVALQRAFASGRRRWRAVTVACAVLGMGCKEEFAAAPLLLLLYDRAFFATSWQEVRGRLGWHARIAASWGVLLWCILAGPENTTVGYHTKPAATAWEWLCTQAGVLVHYVRLCIWPSPLRGYYDWPVVRTLGPAVLPGAAVVAALVAIVVAWRRCPWWGFVGALFFLQLAPTSSILPIVVEVAGERRMYVPMLAVLLPLLIGLERLLARRGPRANRLFVPFVAMVGIGAAAATRTRLPAYADQLAFWTDVYRQTAPDSRSFQAGVVFSNYGLVQRLRGAIETSNELLERSIACASPPPTVRMHYAMALVDQGYRADAEKWLREVVQEQPGLSEAHGNLATLLLNNYLADRPEKQLGARDPRLLEAEQFARQAVQLQPMSAAFANTLAYVLAITGRGREAEALYRRAVALEPTRLELYVNLADLLFDLGRPADAKELWQSLLQGHPRDAGLRVAIAELMLQRNDTQAATALLQEALRIDPENPRARELLGQATRSPK